MSLTKKDIVEQREQAQEDIRCILDSRTDDTVITQACQVVVDKMNILIAKLEAK